MTTHEARLPLWLRLENTMRQHGNQAPSDEVDVMAVVELAGREGLRVAASPCIEGMRLADSE